MIVTFKQSVSFFGKDYKEKVEHTLPDAVAKEWYFQALVKGGKAFILDAKAAKKTAELAPPAPASELRHSEAGAPAASNEGDDDIIDESEEAGEEEEVEGFLDGESDEESEESEEGESEASEKPKAKKKKKKKSSR